jgi:hypothetical protein
VVPQNQLLTQVLASNSEDELLQCFIKLKEMMVAARSEVGVDDLLVKRGFKARKKPTDIPKKEFLSRCKQHREEHLYLWSRAVRKAYQDCLMEIEAQSQSRPARK